jgi:hypothetical protein
MLSMTGIAADCFIRQGPIPGRAFSRCVTDS